MTHPVRPFGAAQDVVHETILRPFAERSIGFVPFDLIGEYCGDCGRAKGLRMILTAPSGCGSCDAVITQHRCTSRPSVWDQDPTDTWVCSACGTRWAVEVEYVEDRSWKVDTA